ncbi:MAG TPA: redoxin domain-containing protein [Candidatus Aquabacterium excrementipullorum]|nr:redoxin domain-containing protein [Candidatus Aquabacterium excrementipullorum]
MLRRHFSSALVAGLALACTSLTANAAAEIGQPAPAFSAQGADGKTISLADYKGKTVVLEWTNHDCPFVKKHYDSGNIPRLQEQAAAKGVVWLQVISSAPGQQGQVDGPTALKVNGYRESKPAGTVLDPQGTVGKLYGAQTTPHIFIIDAQGKLAYKGGIDSIASTNPSDIGKAEKYVANALTAITSGQKVAQASTRPYGCSVKYAS